MRVLKPTPTFSGNTVHETNRWCGYGAYIPAAVCKLLSISSISCSRKEESGPGDALISKGVERTFSAIFAFIPASTSGSSRPRLWLVCCWSDVIRMLLGLLVDLNQPNEMCVWVCMCQGSGGGCEKSAITLQHISYIPFEKQTLTQTNKTQTHNVDFVDLKWSNSVSFILFFHKTLTITTITNITKIWLIQLRFSYICQRIKTTTTKMTTLFLLINRSRDKTSNKTICFLWPKTENIKTDN